MLDPKIAGLARRMIQVQLDERRGHVGQEAEVVVNKLVLQGLGRSGAIIQEIHKLCANEVVIRAMLMWQVFIRVMSSLRVQRTETLAIELKNEIENYSPQVLDDLTQIMDRYTRNIGIAEPKSLSSAWGHAMRKVYAEIDLFICLQPEKAKGKEEQVEFLKNVIYVNSPVGFIQIGTGSTANVTQILGSQEQEALVLALDIIKKNVANMQELPNHSKEEIQELIEESLTEVKKPKPNVKRLQSILTGIATTIQTIGSLQPAYQTLKAALLPLGILLP